MSAGLETTVPTAEAVKPAIHDTLSCWALEQFSFLFCIILRYMKSTECSNVVNMIIETVKKNICKLKNSL